MIGDPAFWVILSALLFTIGAIGVVLRRNPLVMFMSIELMLNGVNLAFLSFSSLWNNGDGQIFTFLVMTVAAAEAVVGLGIIIALFRPRARVDIDDIDELRG
ncbi:MAG TPA: NADH-quinone oxidoreductase subunit NuoK [Chloroflexia bacterium]|jgi:NADH-quinone oxidoreductase subunit K|nr:NADH-quinone oxidoreductase subunit NuoK [Chloroflexia bacterium]